MKTLKEWKEILLPHGAYGHGLMFDVNRVNERTRLSKYGCSSLTQYVKFDISIDSDVDKLITEIINNGGIKPAVGGGFIEFWCKRERKISNRERVIYTEEGKLRPKEVAEMTGVSVSAIYQRIKHGQEPLAGRQKPGKKAKVKNNAD